MPVPLRVCAGCTSVPPCHTLCMGAAGVEVFFLGGHVQVVHLEKSCPALSSELDAAAEVAAEDGEPIPWLSSERLASLAAVPRPSRWLCTECAAAPVVSAQLALPCLEPSFAVLGRLFRTFPAERSASFDAALRASASASGLEVVSTRFGLVAYGLVPVVEHLGQGFVNTFHLPAPPTPVPPARVETFWTLLSEWSGSNTRLLGILDLWDLSLLSHDRSVRAT